jgi:hypothetical protein
MRSRALRHRPRIRGDAVTRTVLIATVALTLFVSAGFLFGVASGGRSTVRASGAPTRAKADPDRVTTTQAPTTELPGR